MHHHDQHIAHHHIPWSSLLLPAEHPPGLLMPSSPDSSLFDLPLTASALMAFTTSSLEVDRSACIDSSGCNDVDLDLHMDLDPDLDIDMDLDQDVGGAATTTTNAATAGAAITDVYYQEPEDCNMVDRQNAHHFFALPAELRNLVYEELLVSDCAFRLGHHGPYSHESRKSTYPAILRTSKMALHEASSVLYGNNTFFLGPIGHKPTYSASFLTSIGQHNARQIRMLVAHSTHPISLTQRYLRSWITSFGLDVTRLKVLAVSFNISDGNRQQQQEQQQQQQQQQQPSPSVPSSVSSMQVIPPLASTLTTIILGGGMQTQAQAGQGQQNGAFGTVGVGFGQVGGNQTTISAAAAAAAAVAMGQQLVGIGAGLTTTTMTTTTTTTNAGLAPMTLLGIGDARKEEVVDDYEMITAKMHGWMEPRQKSEVQKWLSLRNTDLRAGEKWLVYVSLTMKKKLGMREVW